MTVDPHMGHEHLSPTFSQTPLSTNVSAVIGCRREQKETVLHPSPYPCLRPNYFSNSWLAVCVQLDHFQTFIKSSMKGFHCWQSGTINFISKSEWGDADSCLSVPPSHCDPRPRAESTRGGRRILSSRQRLSRELTRWLFLAWQQEGENPPSIRTSTPIGMHFLSLYLFPIHFLNAEKSYSTPDSWIDDKLPPLPSHEVSTDYEITVQDCAIICKAN